MNLRRVALGVGFVIVSIACSKTITTEPDAATSPCPPCVIDTDCAGGSICAQLGGDSYCAVACPNGDECSGALQCTAVTTITGDSSNACVDPSSTTCGPPPVVDAGANKCPGYADPNTTAGCTSCTSGGKSCQPNGCYGGWWCDTTLNKCQQPPATCPGTGDAGAPTIYDGGITSSIGIDGGTESLLYFAIVGDTRPASEDDTSHYPTTIISTIFSNLQATTPPPPFVVSTGDYQFSNPYQNEAAAQLALYLNARGSYSGIQFPVIGNHECTGATVSNCGAGNVNGLTNNYKSFMTLMLGPLQKTTPYYVINVAKPDNSWTAKFVFVAANAWDDTQATWLDAALAVPSTYTFIIRHEPAATTTTPGVSPSEAIMAKYPYTLALVGHSHEYAHTTYRPREVIIGNGGAPLATNQNYGFGIVAQRGDGSLAVDMYDYKAGTPDTSFHFAVNADGSPAP